MTTYGFYCGDTFAGAVTHLPGESVDGSPWDIGRLEPTVEFESYRPIFDAEQQLMNEAVALEPGLASELLFDAAEAVQAQIMGFPVRLEGPEGTLTVMELHVLGNEVHWR